MQEKEQLLEKQFGARYAEANLSQICLPEGCIQPLKTWMDKKNKTFLILQGVPGSGKTYLAVAIYKFLFDKFITKRFYNERDLFKKVRSAISNNQGDYLSNLLTFIDDDFLIIDDIGSSGFNEWREEIIFETIDYRYRERKATIFTSNLTTDEFWGLSNGRIASRLFATENYFLNLDENGDLRSIGK